MKKSLRTSAVVPRSLLRSTKFLSAGVVPLSIFAYGCSGSPSIGIDVEMGPDGGTTEASIGIRPAMFDAGPPETSIGIRPAMFDSGPPDTSIGIRPAMFDAASDAPLEDGDTDAETTDVGDT
jgi:hypothetical protein